MNLLPTITPRSDQMNSDDLLGGPRTITVTAVKGNDSADQPVSIYYEGDDGKPFKPCKTSRRVLVHCWGPEASQYVGRRMTLFCDPNVQFGGMKVGGIRISHLSHIDRDMVLALTVTRAKRAPYTVKPLRAEVKSGPGQARTEDDRRPVDREDDGFPGDRQAPQDSPSTAPPSTGELTLAQRADAYEKRITDAPSTVKLKAIRAAGEKLRSDLDAADPERLVELEALWNDRFAECEATEKAGA